MKFNIRLIYLYLFSLVGLVVTVIGGVRLVDLGLKVWVFKGADKYEIYTQPITASPAGEKIIVDTAQQQLMQDRETIKQRQRDLSGALAMIAVGLPLYLYHWKTIQKENREKKNNG